MQDMFTKGDSKVCKVNHLVDKVNHCVNDVKDQMDQVVPKERSCFHEKDQQTSYHHPKIEAECR